MPVGQTLAKKANNGVGYRSTMRFCGTFPQLGAGEEGAQPNGGARERVHAPLLAVDDANRVGDTHSGLAKGLDGLDRGAARGDDVLDEADAVAVLVVALEPGGVADGVGESHVGLVVPSVSSFVPGRRKPSRTRTQAGRVPKGTWPTEDDVRRRFAAGQAHNGTCGRGH